MAIPTPFAYARNIVLAGDFNPKIFQPAWFAMQGLIREEEAEAADIEVIHPDITVFKLTWARIQVARERFDVTTTQEPYFEVIRDLVLGTFRLLEHTPINALGINSQIHFRLRSEEQMHDLGHKLAPKELWSKSLDTPGLAKLTIQGKRQDEFDGFMQVSVEPSSKAKPGVFFAINDHHQVRDADKSIGCSEVMRMLDVSWKPSIERTENIINSILGD